MKRYIAVILTAVLCLSLCACAGGNTSSEAEGESTVSAENTSAQEVSVKESSKPESSKPESSQPESSVPPTNTGDGSIGYMAVFMGLWCVSAVTVVLVNQKRRGADKHE